jgi:hypothetical protein
MPLGTMTGEMVDVLARGMMSRVFVRRIVWLSKKRKSSLLAVGRHRAFGRGQLPLMAQSLKWTNSGRAFFDLTMK